MFKISENIFELFFFVLVFNSVASVEAQSEMNIEEQLKCAEQTYYGTNDLLVNGIDYIPLHPRADGHPYLESNKFHNGIVFIRGKVFANLDINYDLEQEQLILKYQKNDNKLVQIVLSQNIVDSFFIQNLIFVNSKFIPDIISKPQFVIQLYYGHHNFYKSIKKRFYPVYNSLNPNGKYEMPEVSYFIVSPDGKIIKVENKRQFIEYFSKHKTAVSDYFKQNKIKWKKMTNFQLNQLMKFCDSLN